MKAKPIILIVVLIFSIAYGFTQSKLYWVEGGNNPRIMRAGLDGTNPEILIGNGLQQPSGIALDEAAGKMYWTDLGTAKIQRANLDGSNVEDLVTFGITPYAIALDLANDKMYWTDYANKKIRRSDLDGSNITIVASSASLAPYGITIDTLNEKMYWADRLAEKIMQANLDGTNEQVYLNKIIGYFEPNFDGLSIFPGSGNLYFGETSSLWCYDGILTLYQDTLQSFSVLQFLAVRSDNEIYFTVPSQNKIFKGTITNNYMTVELIMAVPEPHGIAIAEGTTGMKPLKKTGNIMLYPNPTTGQFSVTNATGLIEVLDIYGRSVLTTTLPQTLPAGRQVDLSGHARGIYFVRAGEAAVQKLILQ